MCTIFIHGEPYKVKSGISLLEACLSAGFNVPYFCWHPAIGSVGACRLCAVRVYRGEKDTKGSIVMSCMVQVAEGMHVSIDDPQAVKIRAKVIEWLMLSHPHDCPVCDEGGECHLQDMTVMAGHAYRRTRFAKRTHTNQDLGPFVAHEMNRCIQCYRCQRYYCDYAGGKDFNVFYWHDGVYFGRTKDGKPESEFSGNLVEICPTGVFTDKTLAQHYTRKWDLTTAPSVCVNCSIGCNTIPGARYSHLRRIRARFNSQVNGYFLCDRGRYGYEFVNSDRRVLDAMVRGRDGTLAPAEKEEAIAFAASHIQRGKVIGIGSPRASLESNFALRKLVGPDKFFQGGSPSQTAIHNMILDCLTKGPTPTPSLAEVQSCDAVLILGEDIFNTAPMLGLAVRQASRVQPMEEVHQLKVPAWLDYVARLICQDHVGPVFIATATATRLDYLAKHKLCARRRTWPGSALPSRTCWIKSAPIRAICPMRHRYLPARLSMHSLRQKNRWSSAAHPSTTPTSSARRRTSPGPLRARAKMLACATPPRNATAWARRCWGARIFRQRSPCLNQARRIQ